MFTNIELSMARVPRLRSDSTAANLLPSFHDPAWKRTPVAARSNPNPVMRHGANHSPGNTKLPRDSDTREEFVVLVESIS